MPELPEVETIKSELNRLIKNKIIESVDINLVKQVKNPRSEFLKIVTGRKIDGVRRRAKMLIMDLDSDHHLIFHLKMTGQLIYRSETGKLAGGGHPIKHDLENLPNKYSHVVFYFKGGGRLFFNDLRQFGWVRTVTDDELEKIIAAYGPEPLAKDFDMEKFGAIIKNKKTALKPLLMDQAIVAGVGNIYAQEACYCAGIAPTRPANKLNNSEIKKLFDCLQQILKLAIEKKGTSADNYVDALGRQGSMMPYLKIYNKAGEQCQKCKSVIKSMKQGARTTCYCAHCQK